MRVVIAERLIRAIILDVSGLYAQIYDEGYFERTVVNKIKQQYSDKQHWQVVIIE